MTTMQTLHAPELRADDGTRALTRTQAGILIGSAFIRPAPVLTDDAERLQRALLNRPQVIRLYANFVVRAMRWLRGLLNRKD